MEKILLHHYFGDIFLTPLCLFLALLFQFHHLKIQSNCVQLWKTFAFSFIIGLDNFKKSYIKVNIRLSKKIFYLYLIFMASSNIPIKSLNFSFISSVSNFLINKFQFEHGGERR